MMKKGAVMLQYPKGEFLTEMIMSLPNGLIIYCDDKMELTGSELHLALQLVY